MKQLGVVLLLLGGMLVHGRSPQEFCQITQWRETLRVKCLAQEHNTSDLGRAQTQGPTNMRPGRPGQVEKFFGQVFHSSKKPAGLSHLTKKVILYNILESI